MNEMSDYPAIARDARLKVLEMIYKAQSSHIGSNFSSIDILTVLFDKIDTQKDEIVFSKGWIAASAYYFLARAGVIHEADLERYCQEGETQYIGLVEPHGKFGLRAAGGSMGYGLPFGVGFALAKKLKKEEGTVYVLMSDGELAIGTTWEALLIARQHELNNLKIIIDANGLQAMGSTESVVRVVPEDISKIQNIMQCSGHDYDALESFLLLDRRVLWADTVKGKGVSFMENNNLYHYKNLSEEEYHKAREELIHG